MGAHTAAHIVRRRRVVNGGSPLRILGECPVEPIVGECPLLALSEHEQGRVQCPLSGVKRTRVVALPMSAYDKDDHEEFRVVKIKALWSYWSHPF
jgi:hypothetical protein